MGAVMKSGRYMTTPRGAARAQKRFDRFSTKHGARFAARGVDMGKLGSALGFAASAPTAAPAGVRVGQGLPSPGMGAPPRKMNKKVGRLGMAAMGNAAGRGLVGFGKL